LALYFAIIIGDFPTTPAWFCYSERNLIKAENADLSFYQLKSALIFVLLMFTKIGFGNVPQVFLIPAFVATNLRDGLNQFI